MHRALGSHHETLGQVRRLAGPGLPSLIDVHPALTDLFGRLRDGMHKPGTGTWFTATYQLGFPFSYQISYDYEGEPAWRTPPSPAAYAEEVSAFPRTSEHTPDWLTEHSAQS